MEDLIMRLEGKIAIVTGAGTGIGEAIGHKFAQEGAKLVLAGLSEDPVEDVAAAIAAEGGAAVACLGDLSEPEAARVCVDLGLRTYGRIDILVSNAGVFKEYDHIDIPPIRPVTTRIELLRAICPCCRKPVTASVPADMPEGTPWLPDGRLQAADRCL
jgi:NAD(P)-dependent dehydrogenase (short-subunit alcohol dehydrogenase family)